MKPYISLIIPVYNEEKFIGDTLKGLKNVYDINEILIIDDGSSDNTGKIVNQCEDSRVKYCKLNKNNGKGNALNYGLKLVLEKSDIIGFIDGDLGSCSSEVEKLINPVIKNEVDVTIARFPAAKKKGGFGLVKNLARNSVLEMTGVELTSTLSGQRVFKKDVLKKFDKIPYGYGVEVGMTIDILKYGYKIKEICVDMTHNESSRSLKGFIHRGKQYYHIKKILRKKRKEWR